MKGEEELLVYEMFKEYLDDISKYDGFVRKRK